MSIDLEKRRGPCADDAFVVNDIITQKVQLAEPRRDQECRLVRKLDSRLLAIVVVIYFMNIIDRAAITSARLQGLQTDLGLSDVQYDTVLAILYASYSPAQVPSNMIVNYISRPSLYIGTCTALWGLVSALSGTTNDFAGIMVCRVFIGLLEAALYPGAIYLLSRFYPRKELAFRSAVLTAGLLASNAFGSLWAAGVLGTMNGVRGIAAWRWLFYIEGSVTIFVGFLAIWLLPDRPSNTRWLVPAERHLAQVRLAEDTGEADKDSQKASFFEGLELALTDPKVLIFMLICCSQQLGLSYSNFFPTLIATFGYSTTDTLLLAAPPWIFAAIVTLINARHSDITGERFFHQTVWFGVMIIGYIISLLTMNTSGRYFSLFLMAAGISAYPLTMVWLANTIPRPPAKRSAAIGLANGCGNLGGLMGSYIWKSKWGPEYHQSMVIAICSLALASALSLVIRVLLSRENRRMARKELDMMDSAERERVEDAASLEGITFDEAVRRRMGFRYQY